MEVQLTPDQKAFVRRAIETGRLQREEDDDVLIPRVLRDRRDIAALFSE
jgi:hypothetical protein